MKPETLVRHELVGLQVAVVDATNQDLIGIEGHVEDETQHTLLIRTSDDGERKQVPKGSATFRFIVDETTVIVDGTRLVARPAKRTEQSKGSIWQ